MAAVLRSEDRTVGSLRARSKAETAQPAQISGAWNPGSRLTAVTAAVAMIRVRWIRAFRLSRLDSNLKSRDEAISTPLAKSLLSRIPVLLIFLPGGGCPQPILVAALGTGISKRWRRCHRKLNSNIGNRAGSRRLVSSGQPTKLPSQSQGAYLHPRVSSE